MKVIIYGKDGCINCERAKMLCQIQSLAFDYRKLDGDEAGIHALRERVGAPVSSLPQIFLEHADGSDYVGGYDELRIRLQPPARSAVN